MGLVDDSVVLVDDLVDLVDACYYSCCATLQWRIELRAFTALSTSTFRKHYMQTLCASLLARYRGYK